MSAESKLTELTEEQKATVLAWVDDRVTYREIIELIARPAPEGFGIKTCLGTLSRFISLWKREELLRGIEDDARHAEALTDAQEAAGVDFGKATMRLLQQQLFRSALKSGDARAQMEMMRLLMKHEARMKQLEIAEKNHELARVRFEFNAARMAMQHWYELQKIHQMQGPDQEDKIWMAREEVFVGPNGEKPFRPDWVKKRMSDAALSAENTVPPRPQEAPTSRPQANGQTGTPTKADEPNQPKPYGSPTHNEPSSTFSGGAAINPDGSGSGTAEFPESPTKMRRARE